MRRHFLSLIAMMSLLGTPLAPQAWAEAPTKVRGFFYKIEKDGKTSFLLGTMHAGIPMGAYSPEISVAFDRSAVVLFEGDAEDFYRVHGAEVQQRRLYPASHSLAEEVSPQSIQKLQSMFGEQGAALLMKYKPWTIDLTIGELATKRLQAISHESWDVREGIDSTLLKRAQAKGTARIGFLDRYERKLDEFEASFTAADLDRLLRYPDPVAHQVACHQWARSAYLAGDEQKLETYNASTCETEIFIETMNGRTAFWEPKIDAAFREGNVFVAVGAGHLPGENGLLKFLEDQGYSITRIETGR